MDRDDPDAVGKALLDVIGRVQRVAVLVTEASPETRGRWSIRLSALRLALLDVPDATKADVQAFRDAMSAMDDDEESA